jgi:hypothetical protein
LGVSFRRRESRRADGFGFGFGFGFGVGVDSVAAEPVPLFWNGFGHRSAKRKIKFKVKGSRATKTVVRPLHSQRHAPVRFSLRGQLFAAPACHTPLTL